MRILHIGDIVGRPGRRMVRKSLPDLVRREQIDFVIANGENAAGGSGITPDNFHELIGAGVHCVTLGDHIYRQKQIIGTLTSDPRILKPANFPAEAPGRGWTILPTSHNVPVAVISLLGRVFMRPVDCPWNAVDRALEEIGDQAQIICVDFHAEATSDKQLMGRYLDGRVTSVLGTHTHVATADEEIFPGGTAFQCDIGMTGPYHSILGRDINNVMSSTRTFVPTLFDVAKGDDRLHATVVDLDPDTGRAHAIRRLVLRAESAAPTR